MTKRLTYAGIAADVTDRIRQGEFPRGAKLPSYRQLADSYGVSVETVKRALLVLRASGVVTGMQGRGVFVNRVKGSGRSA